MGYALNVGLSIPIAIVVYMLTEKTIINFTSESVFEERVQKIFVMGFVVGLAYVALALTLFSNDSHIANQSLRIALFVAGGFLVANSVVFSWNDLDEGTKILVLFIGLIGLTLYSYKN